MIGTYLVDEIAIVSYIADAWGKTTRTEQADIKARVEYRQKYVKDQKGQTLLSDTTIFINAGIAVGWNDKIRITKLFGAAHPNAAKEYPVKTVSQNHGFSASHIEVNI